MAALLLLALASRVADIHASLPYSRHPDEGTWADIAMRMCRTGDMNPHHFRKPSLPVYLMAAGFILGAERAKQAGQIVDVDGLGHASVPYYAAPAAAEVAKWVFALISVGALLVLGSLALVVTGRVFTLWLAPAVACVSAAYYGLSWSYLNVDIVGAFFVLAAVAFPFLSNVRAEAATFHDGAKRAIPMGLLAGLAIGSKYNLCPVLLPGVLWFALVEPLRARARWQLVAVLFGAALLAFVATTPYLVLDTRAVIEGALAEVRHYATGHRARTLTAGWPMLRAYLDHLSRSYGLIALLVAAAGVASLAAANYRRALVLFSFPLVFLSYMSLQRVFFERNVVVVHLFLALAVVIGWLELPVLIVGWLERRGLLPLGERQARLTVQAALVVGTALGVPWKTTFNAYWHDIEPRNHAVRWIVSLAPSAKTVLVDKALGIDPRTLPSPYDFVVVDLPESTDFIRAEAARDSTVAIIAPERSASAYAQLLRGAAVRARFGGVSLEPPGLTRNDTEIVSVITR